MEISVPERFNFVRDIVEQRALETPEALALWCIQEQGKTERKITFGQLAMEARRAASFFEQLGVRRGDPVLVVLPRVPQWWIAMLGLIRLGAIPIPGTPQLTTRDIRYRLEA